MTFVEFDVIRLEQRGKFLREGLFSVMNLLVGNVRPHPLNLRFTHGKCPVTALPRKILSIREGSMNPPRGNCLHFADDIGERAVLPDFGKDMNMIAHPVDDDRAMPAFAKNSTQIFENPLSNVVG